MDLLTLLQQRQRHDPEWDRAVEEDAWSRMPLDHPEIAYRPVTLPAVVGDADAGAMAGGLLNAFGSAIASVLKSKQQNEASKAVTQATSALANPFAPTAPTGLAIPSKRESFMGRYGTAVAVGGVVALVAGTAWLIFHRPSPPPAPPPRTKRNH